MAEEDIKRVILGKIRTEKETLLSQTRQECERILNQAKEEASLLKAGYLSQIEKTLLVKKSNELNEIKIGLKQQVLRTQEEKLSKVFALVKETLKAIQRDRDRYKSIFSCLLREALTQPIDKGAGLKLKVNTADRELAQEALKELRIEAKLETKEVIDGGLELCNSEESIIVLNTFASRLNKLMPELHQEINKLLFNHLTNRV